jgi:2-dehydro-3-deoxygluconokinase
MSDVVCFGELLMRLGTPAHHRLATASHLEVFFGGAEANVAVQAAMLGTSTTFVSRLPQNALADRALEELRGLGVATEAVVRSGHRMGLYFVEPGISQRPTNVIYDRAHSAMSQASPEMFDWESIFKGASWFHWSGITPALSADATLICRDACIAAKRLEMTVSFDVNFRSKLWSEDDAAQTLQPLMEYVDVCVCGASDATPIFGLPEYPEGTAPSELAAALAEKFKFGCVAMTDRKADTACQTTWSALLHIGGQNFDSASYNITVADRVGAGDSFTGTLIAGMLQGWEPKRCLDLAVASSALKHTILGDYNRSSLAEIEALAAGMHGGRVSR